MSLLVTFKLSLRIRFWLTFLLTVQEYRSMAIPSLHTRWPPLKLIKIIVLYPYYTLIIPALYPDEFKSTGAWLYPHCALAYSYHPISIPNFCKPICRCSICSISDCLIDKILMTISILEEMAQKGEQLRRDRVHIHRNQSLLLEAIVLSNLSLAWQNQINYMNNKYQQSQKRYRTQEV